jgi:hypothetical protein
LQGELEKVLKHNMGLALIQLQYEKEIARRRASVVDEECKHQSPLRRNRAYQLGVGGSPSPKKQTVIFDPDGRKIACLENEGILRIKPHDMVNEKTKDFDPVHSTVKKVSNLK